MENREIESVRKRKKETEKKQEETQGNGQSEAVEEKESLSMASEEMEANISRILQKIEHFTDRVSELLDAGKKLFKEMSNDLEEKLIRVHEEQMVKWTEEIKELRFLDSTNEEIRARLHKVQYLLQNIRDSQD